MRRRQFLASVPVAVGLAGCPGDSDSSASSTPDSSASSSPKSSASSASPTGTPSDTQSDPRPEREPLDAVARTAVRHIALPDSIAVDSPIRDQFAFVRAPDIDDDPQPFAFTLALDERRIDAKPAPWTGTAMPTVETLYRAEDPTGWLVFDVPTVDVSDPALEYDGRRYRTESDFGEALAATPEFEPSVSVPESATVGDSVELTVDVTNSGDRRGMFLGGVQYGGLPRTITAWVPPGETRSAVVTYEPAVSGSMNLVFRHPGGQSSYEVTIQGTETP